MGDAVHGEHVAGHDRKRLLCATKSRAGTRWSAALTVVSSTAARSRPLQRAQGATAPSSVGRRSPRAATRGRKAGSPRPETPDRRDRARKTQRTRERGHARPVAAHHDDARRRRAGARRNSAGEIGHDEPLGAVGDACKVSGRPGTRSSAGLRAMPSSQALPVTEIAQPSEQRGVVARRHVRLRR